MRSHSSVSALGLLLSFLSAVCLPLQAQTQTPEPAAEPTPTREEVESYVKQMNDYLATREERASHLVSQIVELDKSLNDSVSGIILKLKAITDTQDSKTKVTRIKRDVIDRIGRAARYYANERAKLDEALRVTGNTFRREDLYKERAQFDAKIDKMVNAVVELAGSMDTHQDLEKYLYEVDESSRWRDDTTIRKNPEYEQNRRSTTQSDSARKQVDQALQQSLDRLNTSKRELEARLASGNLNADQKTQVQGEIDRLAVIIAERFSQLEALQNPEPQFTGGVGLSEALQLDNMVQLVVADARRDIASIFARYRELRTERDVIADQRARLARAEQWLKDNPDAK